jgi:hypothetical protein
MDLEFPANGKKEEEQKVRFGWGLRRREKIERAVTLVML